jgi:hypothetical protein
VDTSTAMIVNVGAFKFVKDEKYPWIDIYMEGGERDEFIEQVDGIEDEPATFDEFTVWAINWVFNNVEVVKGVKAE